MQKTKLKIIIVLCLIIFLLVLCITGCWSRRELDKLAIISGIGIDRNEKGQVELTAEVIKPKGVKQDSGGGTPGKPDEIFISAGNTVFDALRNSSFEAGRRLYLSHNNLIIFGYDVAQQGVRDYLDFFIRDYETRRDVWILVSRNKAGGIFEASERLENVTAENLDKIVITSSLATSQIMEIDMQNFLQRLMSKTQAPVAPIIEISEQGNDKKLFISNTAVFKEDKLVGELNREETRGLLWITGDVNSGIVTVSCSGRDDKASIEILKADSKITPVFYKDNIDMLVEINVDGNLGGQMCPVDFALPGMFNELEDKFAMAVKQEAQAAVYKAMELNADVFGFGDIIHQRNKKIWDEELQSKWDDYFPGLEVTIVTKAKLRRTGLITKTPIPQ